MRHERPLSTGETRSSALWGKGTGGQSRGSALWGKGGRSGIALLMLMASAIVPASGIADPGNGNGNAYGKDKSEAASAALGGRTALVPNDLIEAAQANPNRMFHVIVQGDQRGNSKDVASAVDESTDHGKSKRVFDSIVGTGSQVKGSELLKLARHPRVKVISWDEQLEPSSYEDSEMWRLATGVSKLQSRSAVTCPLDLLGIKLDPTCVASAAYEAPQTPTIAIVDSGIDATKTEDFGNRVIERVNFSSLESDAAGDPQGHGTMVAGVAAGSSSKYPGVAPKSNLVDVRTAASNGQSLTSDVIAAIDWIIANKDRLNIRVANFSMSGDKEASYRTDPLNRAIENLWFSGVVVVAAAGNHGLPDQKVKLGAPANDPFVITVGALDQHQSASPLDDTRASWSAYGHTADGYAKPDLSAPGRWLIMPVPAVAAIPTAAPERVVAPGYMWMSGTSFSAPMVAGVAAHILAKHPEFTPDQVKGALMVSAEYLPSEGISIGVGALDAAGALAESAPPDPNENLKPFLKDNGRGGKMFDEANWTSTVKANANWTAANWTAANWTAAKWSSSNWVSANWTSANWTSYTYTDANWVQASWSQSTMDE